MAMLLLNTITVYCYVGRKCEGRRNSLSNYADVDSWWQQTATDISIQDLRLW